MPLKENEYYTCPECYNSNSRLMPSEQGDLFTCAMCYRQYWFVTDLLGDTRFLQAESKKRVMPFFAKNFIRKLPDPNADPEELPF